MKFLAGFLEALGCEEEGLKADRPSHGSSHRGGTWAYSCV